MILIVWAKLNKWFKIKCLFNYIIKLGKNEIFLIFKNINLNGIILIGIATRTQNGSKFGSE
jgi:hypothetical protein